jgi:hypothetical protein
VSVSVLLAVAGCGHDPEPKTVAAPAAADTGVPPEAVSEAPPVTHSPAPKATVSKKPVHKATPPAAVAAGGSAGVDRFVAAVQRKLPEVALDRRDEEVEDLGRQACAALGAGRSATVAAGEVAEQGVAPSDARTLVGLAKDDLCRA